MIPIEIIQLIATHCDPRTRLRMFYSIPQLFRSGETPVDSQWELYAQRPLCVLPSVRAAKKLFADIHGENFKCSYSDEPYPSVMYKSPRRGRLVVASLVFKTVCDWNGYVFAAQPLHPANSPIAHGTYLACVESSGLAAEWQGELCNLPEYYRRICSFAVRVTIYSHPASLTPPYIIHDFYSGEGMIITSVITQGSSRGAIIHSPGLYPDLTFSQGLALILGWLIPIKNRLCGDDPSYIAGSVGRFAQIMSPLTPSYLRSIFTSRMHA